jgi:uncharacterized LabA/DUF88 family protein
VEERAARALDQPIQQFRYTVGKNATDSAMIIDAMDLLYTGNSTASAWSSDSDFTRLAARIRESGRRVYGFGEKKTPRPFVAACDRFLYTDLFAKKPGAATAGVLKARPRQELQADATLVGLINGAIEAESDEGGWAPLSAIGSYVSKTATDFDPRNYGYGKLSELVKAMALFDLERRESHIHVRVRSKAPARSRNNKTTGDA